MIETALPPDSLSETIIRLLIATIAGMVIGAERELRAKPAGVRTHGLVALGSALAVLTAALLDDSASHHGEAISRVMQGLVAGIGFLGAGVILQRAGDAMVHGLTTAASLWVVSVVGMASGLGLWRVTAIATGIVLLLLVAERPLARLLGGRQDDATTPPSKA